MGHFRGFIVQTPPGLTPYPGSDVRGYGRFHGSVRMSGLGATATASSNPVELRARLTAMVDSLKRDWEWVKFKIKAREVAWSYLASVPSYVAGFQTIDNVIGLKYASINDVLGGQLALDKWLSGMDVARQEIMSYADYVQNNGSVRVSLDQLGRDLQQTSTDYGASALKVGGNVAKGLAIATPFLLLGAGFLIWKVGLPLAQAYLGIRRPREAA